MPVLEANGEMLNYVQDGSGPDVVLIHSLGASNHIWRAQIEALKDRYRLTAFDCRGHGGSSANGRFTIENVASDIIAGIEVLGIARCHVIGLSFGGPIILSLINQWPEGVASAVIADSFVKLHEGGEARVAATRDMFAKSSMAEFGRHYAKTRLMPATPAATHDELAEVIGGVSPEVYIQAVEAIALPDYSGLLPGVKVPTLVMMGKNDTQAPLSSSQAIVDGIPGSALEVIADAGHLCNLDKPAEFTAAVAAFLDAQPR